MPSQLFGLLAHPVSHSLSPVLYRQWFEECGMKDAKFELFDVLPEELSDFMKKMRSFLSGSKFGSKTGSRIAKISGLAVSIPHKETILQYLDEIDPVAAEIGAVNTISWMTDYVSDNSGRKHSDKNSKKSFGERKLKGWNTDWIGVLESFQEAAVTLNDKRVLILGAGGAARAVVYACMKEGAHVVITNRTYEKAETLAAHFRCSVIDWEDRESATADIVINTTSVGLDNPDLSPVSRGVFEKFVRTSSRPVHSRRHVAENLKMQPGGCIAFDLVYRPFMTKFLRDAARAGACIITGDRMLFHQGKAQFDILTRKSNVKLNSQPAGKMNLSS